MADYNIYQQDWNDDDTVIMKTEKQGLSYELWIAGYKKLGSGDLELYSEDGRTVGLTRSNHITQDGSGNVLTVDIKLPDDKAKKLRRMVKQRTDCLGDSTRP